MVVVLEVEDEVEDSDVLVELVEVEDVLVLVLVEIDELVELVLSEVEVEVEKLVEVD